MSKDIFRKFDKNKVNFERLRKILPPRIARSVWFGRARYCPICKSYVRKFLDFGMVVSRLNAQCPICDSLERHRFVWLFFQHQTNLCDQSSKSMLHVAPEEIIESKLRQIPNLNYLSADLFNARAMVKMDVTDIQYPDNSFDVIYCSHVLEHVIDDRKAMREFYRILKPNGWSVIQVPITGEKTFEGPSVTDPIERERLFGQNDHVRRYGPDLKDRLEKAGFNVKLFTPSEEVTGVKDNLRIGVPDDQRIFFCEKR